MRRRAGHDVKTGAFGRPFYFAMNLLPGRCEAALVASGGVFVDQAFARSAVEKLDGRQPLLGVSAGGRPLEGRAKSGFLGAIANGCRA